MIKNLIYLFKKYNIISLRYSNQLERIKKLEESKKIRDEKFKEGYINPGKEFNEDIDRFINYNISFRDREKANRNFINCFKIIYKIERGDY